MDAPEDVVENIVCTQTRASEIVRMDRREAALVVADYIGAADDHEGMIGRCQFIMEAPNAGVDKILEGKHGE